MPVALLPTPINGPVEPGNPDPGWLARPDALPKGFAPPAPVESVGEAVALGPLVPDMPLVPVMPPGPVAPVAVVGPLIPGDCNPAAAPRPVVAMPANGSPKNPFTVVLF